MDIQVSSNFERLLFDLYDREGAAVAGLMEELSSTGAFALSQGAREKLAEEFDSARVDQAQTLATIARIRGVTGQILDPHTAVGVHAAELVRGDPAVPMIALGTAHAAKFPDAVEKACGVRPALPPRMADLYEREERLTVVPNDLGAVESLIQKARAH